MKNNIKALFIGGAGHSGTTMLSKIFGNHENALKVHGETRVPDSLGLLSKEYLKLKDNKTKLSYLENATFYGVTFKKKTYQHQYRTDNSLINILSSEELTGDFCKDYYSLIKKALLDKNKDYFVEKTPSNVFHADEVFNLIPESKLLIIHRDVRDVVASLKKRYLNLLENPEIYKHNLSTKKLDKDYNLIIDALMWNKAVLKSFKALTEYGESKVKIISYENFVINPEEETKSICNWLNISYQPQMLELKARNSSDINVKKEKGISNSSVANFSKTLNPEEIAVIEKYAKTGLKKLDIRPYEHFNRINKSKVIRYEVKSYLKVLSRIRKRLALMSPSYALNFSKRFLKKLFNR